MTTSYLSDVNIWIAYLVQTHPHYEEVRRWFDGLAPGQAGLCRFTQLSVIRLMGTATVMKGQAVSAAKAWSTIQELRDDERVEFLEEPASLDEVLPTLFRYSTPTPKLANDAYLAAFATASHRRLLTLDRGFQQFQGLDVEILGE